ncbi:MAG: glycoside hydrolase family 31 protein [Bacteroidota bacterium]
MKDELVEDLMVPNAQNQDANQVVHVDDMEKHQRYPDVFTEYRPNQVRKTTQQGQRIYFHCENEVSLCITILEAGIIRFCYSPNGQYPDDFSYAIDPQFQRKPVEFTFAETASHVLLQTPLLSCFVNKADLKVRIENAEGQTLSEDEKGFYARSTILNGFEEISMSKKAVKGEYFLGLGDKSGQLNLRGGQFVNWNTDSFAFGAQTDPLYRSIPFYYGIREKQCYGIFFDNSYRTHFDFDQKENGETRFWADGGALNYYFFAGPTNDQVAQAYTRLTGKPELPPIWALGFHQCRWSYYPEARVRELAQAFRDRQIPCDAIYLDIDYMDEYRCFTWNQEHFPQPTQLIKELKAAGFQTVVMIDPGIKADDNYAVFAEAKARDYFCRRLDGELMRGPVWPPACAFPDFTLPEVRTWWGQLYAKLYNENGVSGFWNDMNEPAVFGVNSKTFPDQVRHDYDGHPTGHRKAHNIYGMQMSRSTYEGLKALQTQTRPFVLTRATYSGGQRFASVWTGDNIASWEHLQIANAQCQRLSISGFSFVGTDIGGFSGVPDGELMIRWLQLGVYHPLYRVHSMGNNVDGGAAVDGDSVKANETANRLDQEPWSFGEPYTTLARSTIEWRYQLLPYLYTAFWKYCQNGQPILRPLSFVYPENDTFVHSDRDFLFGPSLLVSPVIHAKVQEQSIELPSGDWYDLFSGKAYAGKQIVVQKVDLKQIPTFVKAGTVLPLYPVQQFIGEKAIISLQLKIFYLQGEAQSELYEDAGQGYAYQNDHYSLRQFTCTGTERLFEVRQSKSGAFQNTYNECQIRFYGLPFEVDTCWVDEQEMAISLVKDEELSYHELRVKADFQQISLGQ